MSVVVIGQIARDLVLRTEELPERGGSTDVVERYERLGGKGANQAVGLAQLAVPAALVGVVGDDAAGADVLAQARHDRIDVRTVVRRGTTALLVDVVDAPGSRRLLEHVPVESLLSVDDVRAARDIIRRADTVVLQLQQPADALLEAASLLGPDARLVLDGTVEDEATRRALVRRAEVVRADATEAQIMTGARLSSVDDAVRAGQELLLAGPSIVALAVRDEADVVVWPEGVEVLPLTGEVVDPTGAGDAFVAGLVAALRGGADHRSAARVAAACARSSVGRLGGRPALTPALLARQ